MVTVIRDLEERETEQLCILRDVAKIECGAHVSYMEGIQSRAQEALEAAGWD